MVALVAVMHKLIFIIFAVLRDKKPFELRTPEEDNRTLGNKARNRLHTFQIPLVIFSYIL
jgi:hypothetical protein